jgi:hypothetical protein
MYLSNTAGPAGKLSPLFRQHDFFGILQQLWVWPADANAQNAPQRLTAHAFGLLAPLLPAEGSAVNLRNVFIKHRVLMVT